MPTFLEQEGSITPISKILSCSLKMQVLSSQVRFGDRLFQIWEDWETDSVLNLESKEGSQETGKAKSWWRRRYYKCPRNIKPFSVPVSRSAMKSRRKSFTFLEKKKTGLYPYSSVPLPIAILYSFCNTTIPQLVKGTWVWAEVTPRLLPACLCHASHVGCCPRWRWAQRKDEI